MLSSIPIGLVLPISTMAVIAFMAAAPAQAARTYTSSSAITTGVGPRVGFSSDPEQLVIGGQMVFGEVAPSVTFDPSVEIGVGDNRTLLGINFDMHAGRAWRYPSRTSRDGWHTHLPSRDEIPQRLWVYRSIPRCR